MNRSAYFTTGLAIKTLANLSKANVLIHGQDNVPDGPIIFVVNHFTRLETLLLPYYLYNITNVPAFSLAADVLFKGSLNKLLDMVGVISTKNPNRDKIIIKGLLTGKENWIIFPEGRMVKTKKTLRDGSFWVSYEGGKHKPHTGAASLLLRAELFRHHLMAREHEEPENVEHFLRYFDLDSLEEIKGKKASILPINLTYYPIRARENIALSFASKIMKDVPERMAEEIMTEGTMLLSGVDLDINIGSPINAEKFLLSDIIQKKFNSPIGNEPGFSPDLSEFMRAEAYQLMKQYMKDIYDMTTINHEHLFASFLKLYPYTYMHEAGLRRRAYLAAQVIRNQESIGCNLHKSLKDEQTHLLTDDRFDKVNNFIDLAVEKEVVKQKRDYLVKVGTKITDLLQFHTGRIDNPIKVMANEVEPLANLEKLIRRIAWLPDFVVKYKVIKDLLEKEKRYYTTECSECGIQEKLSGEPFLMPGATRKIGVVLIHSYLAGPQEVKEIAEYLNRQGLWVYALRLAGHGTTPENLAATKYGQWQHSVEKGYALMSTICSRVVVGGVSIGGCLALDLASRLKKLAGVIAICPPLQLKDYSSSFMPSLDVWNRILNKLKKNVLDEKFFEFTSENPYVNYDKNPVLGVREVGSFLEFLRSRLEHIQHPALIIHADRDPVVDSRGSKIMYEELGTESKEYVLMNYDNHVIVNGEDARRVQQLIGSFIRDVTL